MAWTQERAGVQRDAGAWGRKVFSADVRRIDDHHVLLAERDSIEVFRNREK
jgi:hypothetical protein